MHHSGRAIMYNAFVVASGFAVLLVSVFPPNRQVGGLVALNMAVSFLGTVTVLFLLLYRGNAFGQDKQASTLTNNEEEETYA
ncbi:MAG: MMPL family transporter [Spirochaetota bacterium]